MSREGEQSTSLSELLENLDCSICYESKQLLLLPCQHRFCADCIGSLTTSGHEICCPDCRRVFNCPDEGFPVCRLARAVREHIQQHMMQRSASQTSVGQENRPPSPISKPPSDALSEDTDSVLEIECQDCGKKLEARCSICRQFLCFRCFAKSPCTESADTRHDPVDFEFVVEESNMILDTWRYNINTELSAIKNKKKRRDNQAIVDATNDAIDIQVHPVERILMIEHITCTIATGKTLAPETYPKEKKAAEADTKCKPMRVVSDPELQSKEKLSEEIEKRLAATHTIRRLSKQKSKEKRQGRCSLDIIRHATSLYAFDAESREDCTTMVEGEQVAVVAEDDGSGWTKIVNSQGCMGFVPTSYLDLSISSKLEQFSSHTQEVPNTPNSGDVRQSPVSEIVELVAQVHLRPESIWSNSENGNVGSETDPGTPLGNSTDGPGTPLCNSTDGPRKATALYEFKKGNLETCLDLGLGEEVDVLEMDSGYGWTMVRNGNGEQGCVPTSFLCLF